MGRGRRWKDLTGVMCMEDILAEHTRMVPYVGFIGHNFTFMDNNASRAGIH